MIRLSPRFFCLKQIILNILFSWFFKKINLLFNWNIIYIFVCTNNDVGHLGWYNGKLA